MMLLSSLRLVPGKALVDIALAGERISGVTLHTHETGNRQPAIHFENAIAFPGLINSHDHLDFNCFPRFEKTIYKNYRAWGADIHQRYKQEINDVLKIPQALRTEWGIYKNLLAGVTTVVNHGAVLGTGEPLITVRQESQHFHSVGFENQWKWKLNNPLKINQPCVIHTGEGTDEIAENEIDELIKWNLLKRKLIGIHAVAMNSFQAKKFEAIVWCPESNMFLLNKTADISALKNYTQVLFGTDSTLTGNWSIWQHFRLARDMQKVTEEELFAMATSTPAATWNTNAAGIIAGQDADIVIAKAGKGDYVWDDFFATEPEDILMVVHQGKIRLFDDSLLPRLEEINIDTRKFKPVALNGSNKFLEGDLPALISSIKTYYPKAAFPVNIFNAAVKVPHA